MKFSMLLLLFSTTHICVKCAKILGLFPMVAHSHYIVGGRLMTELAERGHEVTMISPFPQKTPLKNYRDISLAHIIPEFKQKFNTRYLDLDSKYLVQTIPFYYTIGEFVVEKTLNDTNVQKLLKSKEHFDVIIIEQFYNEALTYFSHHFNAPYIIVNSIPSCVWTNQYVANPAPLSHVPIIWLSTGLHMSLFQRISNVFHYHYEEIIKNIKFLPRQNEVLHKYHPDAPHLNDLMKNISLILLNSHSSINAPYPHVPNMIEIGGYHIKEGVLPKDLKDFLDEADEGVIYFCMGSNLKISEFDPDKLQAFFKVFGRLKQRVLWKFEVDHVPGQPDNVKFVNWAPQQDVLAHPNVKLFISHGGLLGTIEAVYFGVPIVGIPIFGDQRLNIATLVSRGFALTIPYSKITEAKLEAVLTEILTNKKYAETAKAASRIMHDRVVKPIDEAVYWVEYVMRHPGAEHFRSAAMDLNWFQYNLIDVIAIVCVGFALVIKIILIFVRLVKHKLIKTETVRKSKKNR